jgi:hypothetical protein
MARRNSKLRATKRNGADARGALDGVDTTTEPLDQTDVEGGAEPAGEEDDADEEISSELFPRNMELAEKAGVTEALVELYADVEEGFQNQLERTDNSLDNWDLYNCKLGANQFYNGNSQVFVPIIKNAVNARKTRFVNQLFPTSGRNVETISSEGTPTYLVSLLEHYIRRTKMRTRVAPALLKNGDVEGQYSLYAGWRETKRNIAYRVKVPTADEKTGADTGEEHDDIKEETIEEGAPYVEVIADADLLVLPATARGVYDALDSGGSVTVIRRWSKSKIMQMGRSKEIGLDMAKKLASEFDTVRAMIRDGRTYEKQPDAAGIHVEEDRLHAVVYETWTNLSVGNHRVLCRVLFGGSDLVVSCRRNPYWSDRCPVFSAPVEVVEGSFKGVSLVEPCASMQIAANDACNEAMDSAAYALMPIVMTDPNKNPRVGSMVLSMAAIWEVDPNSTQFAKFPDIWKSGFEIIAAHKQEIFQTLSVSPAIIPQLSQSHTRLNAAEISNEQQVDLLTTSDSVTNVEDLFSGLINFFAELDHQYRKKEITVSMFGQMGMRANMESVPLLQFDKRYEFRWFGVEQSRNAQAIQQQIAALNVLRGIPPEQYAGYKLNLVPIILQFVENTFGPRIAPQIFQSLKDQLAVPVETEDKLMLQGLDLPVHPVDEDGQHIQAHQKAMEAAGDPHGTFREHIIRHIQQQSMKAQQAAQQPGGPMGAPQGEPGIPGGQQPGGGPAPGVAGTPKAGAQPMMPRGGQNPPGAIHRDQLHDPHVMPRTNHGRGQ